jgi:hypothetical protein
MNYMAIKPHIAFDERLMILREMDRFRSWESLDDQRFCILCERHFSGRQVEISRKRGGHLQLHCPTVGCEAGANLWVYPGNPLVSDASYDDWCLALGQAETSPEKTAATFHRHHA